MMYTCEKEIEVTIGEDTIVFDAIIEFDYDPAEPDQWFDANGDPGTPGVPEYICITSVIDPADGNKDYLPLMLESEVEELTEFIRNDKPEF